MDRSDEAALAAYIEHGEGSNLPDLDDLPGLLDRIPPERKDIRDAVLDDHIALSRRRQWAWEGLRRLLRETRGREPEALKRWACDVASGRRRAPPKTRGTVRKDAERARLWCAYLALGGDRPALETLETALGWDESTIRKSLPGNYRTPPIHLVIPRGR